MGTLAVVPAGSRSSSATVEVAMTVDGADLRPCFTVTTDPVTHESSIPSNCVVARRIFRFLAHRDRTLPVRLDSRCLGVACAATETCLGGRCAPANVDGPGFLDRCPDCPDAAADVVAVVDSGDDADAGVDGGPTLCTTVAGGSILYDQVPNITEATEHLAVDDENVFWIASDPANGTFARGMKRSAVAKPTDYAMQGAASATPLASIATDGVHLYVGNNNGVEVIDIATKFTPGIPVGLQFQVGASLVAGSGKAWVSARKPATDPFLVLYEVDGTNRTSTKLGGSHGGAWLTKASDRVWAQDTNNVFDSPTDGGAFGLTTVPDTHAIAACDDPSCPFGKDVFVTHDISGSASAILRVQPAPTPLGTPLLTGTTKFGAIAVEGDVVYFVDQDPKGARVRYFRLPLGASGVRDLETTTYSDVIGLAVRGCVFFWARAKTSNPYQLHVAPRAP